MGQSVIKKKIISQKSSGSSGSNVVTSIIYPVNTDVNTTDSTNGIDIADLTIPLLASSRYIVRGAFTVGCSGTGGVKLKATLAGSTASIKFLSRIASNDTARWSAIGTGSYSSALSTANSSSGGVIIDSTITTTTAGNLVFNIASGTSGQTSTLFSEGSYLEVIKIS